MILSQGYVLSGAIGGTCCMLALPGLHFLFLPAPSISRAAMPLPPLWTRLLFGLFLLAGSAVAQEPESPRTTVVEILGLEDWTRQMVEDSVAKYQPGISLADHSCAVILRDSVGFAQAASQTYNIRGRDTVWVVLPVVEPRMRDRVRFRNYHVKRPPVQEWTELAGLLNENPRSMSPLQHPEVLLAGADSVFGSPVPAETRDLRRKLRSHATPRDWDLARTTILTDSSIPNRTVAALVLSNFPDRDSTFYLLAEGLRGTDSGTAASNMVLSALTRGAPRPVDWIPARDALVALLGGTNLFAYTTVLSTLAVTEIDPAMGRALAQLNPALLLDHLGAENPFSPPPAHRFLTHISGQDFGRNVMMWEQWLSTP